MTIHPWLNSPECHEATRLAVSIPMGLMGPKAEEIGESALLKAANAFMLEAAIKTPGRGTPRSILLRSGRSHMGSMWDWPDDDMSRFAVREIGYSLNCWLRAVKPWEEAA